MLLLSKILGPATMLQRIKQFFRTLRLKRLLLVTVLTGLAALLALIIIISALPAILSTPAVQTSLRSSLTKALKRQVSWSKLTVSWAEGLELKGLALAAGPAPLLNLTMDELTLVPQIGFREGRVRLDLALRSRNIAAECAPGPAKPPKPYREPLTAIAEAVQKFQGLDWPLPLDLGLKVAVEPVSLAYRDPGSGRSLTLSKLFFLFDMPSLADKPVFVTLRSDLAVDGHRLEALSLSVDLRRLVTVARRINPAGAQVAVKAALPGTTLTLTGGLQESAGFRAEARLHLPRIMVAYGPLLPKTAPTLGGELALDLLARVDGRQNLHAALELSGSQLTLSGGRLRQARIGPLNLRLKQKLVSDHKQQQVRFTEGSATSGTLLEAAWEASVDRPAARDRDLTARLGPVRVDLQQALAVAGPLLPVKFPVRELAGELTLGELHARLPGRTNSGEVTLAGLGITLPALRLALAKGGVTAAGVELAIARATIPLLARQPTRIDAALSYRVASFALSGAAPLVAEGLQGSLQLALTELNLKSRSPRRFAAVAELKQGLELRRVRLEKKLVAETLHEQLTALIRAGESGEIEVTLPELKISAAGLQAAVGGKQLQSLPLTAVISAAGIRLAAAKGAAPVVERASCTLSGGDFLKLSATGSLSDGTPQRATTDGTLKVDLARIMPLAAPFLPKGAAAGGSSSLAWSLAAPLGPPPTGKGKNPLARARAVLGMVERGELTLSLDSRAVSWPLKGGSVNVAALQTAQPLRLVLPERGGKTVLEGAVAFTGLVGLPGAAGKLPAQSGSLTLQGELADWQSLKLREELQIQPLGLVQRGAADISRIGMLLEKEAAISSAAILQQLDGVVSADLETRFPATSTPLPGGIELSGESRVGVQLNLAAGRELKLRATAASRDFGVRLANGTALEGVRTDLLIDRTYALDKAAAVGWTPLSVSLLHPPGEQSASAGMAEIVSRVREDLRGQGSGSRKFSIKRLVTPGGRSLELTSLEGDLLLSPEELGLSFFQAEVLGGTVRLRSLIDLKAEIPTVATACSFTNLETFLLLSPEIRKKSTKTAQDTELTGELSFETPLMTGQRELLEGIRLQLNLRKIGADTLERALFGLDPDERNEQLVAQRKLLRHGALQVLRASSLDGAFSLEGEVQVKGVKIDLPKVERLRLSELPIKKQMTKALAGIVSLRKVLELARADTLLVGPKGEISLVRRGHE